MFSIEAVEAEEEENEKEATEVVDKINEDVVEIHDETFAVEVSHIAEEAIVDLIDELCPEEEYSLKCEGIPQVDGSFVAEVESLGIR